MKTKIRWAEVHAPLFLSDSGANGGKGINLGQKLCTKSRTGLELEYDEQAKHLFVSYQGMTVRVPETSVLSMVEADKTPREQLAAQVRQVQTQDTPTGAPAKGPDIPPPFDTSAAQVSSPQGHVFAGPGAGLTGQEPPKVIQEALAKRGPGRPPKDK